MKLLLCVLLALNVQAEMVVMKKGQEALFDGILADQKQMEQFRQTNEEKKILELQNMKLKDLAAINDQRIDLYKQEVKEVRADLSSSQRKTILYSVGYFVLGVLVTGFAAKAAIESTR